MSIFVISCRYEHLDDLPSCGFGLGYLEGLGKTAPATTFLHINRVACIFHGRTATSPCLIMFIYFALTAVSPKDRPSPFTGQSSNLF